MDMSPWQRINPCGLGVEMTQLADLINTAPPTLDQVTDKLTNHLMTGLGYNDVEMVCRPLPALNGEF
jgi:lipoyl(octanoyl) transferase